MSICLSRSRDTRIEEDSDNSTSYKYLLVRNVFGITFFFSSYFCLTHFFVGIKRSKTFFDKRSGIAERSTTLDMTEGGRDRGPASLEVEGDGFVA